MNYIDILKSLKLSKYQINKMRKNPSNKLFNDNLHLVKKYYKTKKKFTKQIGGNIDSEVDNLLKMIENLINQKSVDIENIKANDVITQKNLKDLEYKYEFLESLQELIHNMLELYVLTQVANDILIILEDQYTVVSNVMNGKSSTKKLKPNERVMVDNILKNNEQVHPDMFRRILNFQKSKIDKYNTYIKLLDELLKQNFTPNQIIWNYRSDSLLLKNKAKEVLNKLEDFKENVDLKYLIKLMEENLNIFDGCYCNSKCTFQKTPNTPHWCYTQHERCRRGLQSKAFNNPTKTCNPLRNDEGIMTAPVGEHYMFGNHPMVHQTNRAIICTTQINGITKFTGNYKCPGGAMSVNTFIKKKKQDYRNTYRKFLKEYYNNLKNEILNTIKTDIKTQGTQTKHKGPIEKIRQRNHPDAAILGSKYKKGSKMKTLRGGKKSKKRNKKKNKK